MVNYYGTYVPRNCANSGKIIGPKDYTSVQIALANIEDEKIYSGSYGIYAFSGKIRKNGKADSSINVLEGEKNKIIISK